MANKLGEKMTEKFILANIEADAIRFRLSLRDQSQAELNALIAQVIERVGAPNNAQVQMTSDGKLVVVVPELANEHE
jgi:phosphotransferase system IIB component